MTMITKEEKARATDAMNERKQTIRRLQDRNAEINKLLISSSFEIFIGRLGPSFFR